MNFCEGFRRASERDWMLTPKKEQESQNVLVHKTQQNHVRGDRLLVFDELRSCGSQWTAGRI